MKINIICGDEGWIYSKFIEMFKKHSKHEILLNSKEKCPITHIIPYYESIPKNVEKVTGWFSHMEQKSPLKEKFITAAREVDVAISQSEKYAWVLKRNMVGRVVQIMPGVDLDFFKARGTKRPDNKKLMVGLVGRMYSSSNRKNPALIKRISELPFVDFRMTGGKVNGKDLPKFYADMDVIVSPSLTEGGPLAITESLSVGCPILCYESVGVADEFGTGVIRVPYNDSDEFCARLKTIWATKSYLHYRDPSVMREMRKQVKNYTWEAFANAHDKVWEGLVK